MAEREKCLFCLRERATAADWEVNASLPSDREDEEAERLGLNKLCWESESDDCTNAALESLRPTNLADALAQHDRLLDALRQIGDAAKAEEADPLEWAVWAHDLAQEQIAPYEPASTQQDQPEVAIEESSRDKGGGASA